ncbi:hypothetical protein [Mesorhizobium sp. M0619]|uniref:hypothetical protein n=1 Tax=unclassified Mesorhizobium TaxID=325217 RepID=UPI00333CB295
MPYVADMTALGNASHWPVDQLNRDVNLTLLRLASTLHRCLDKNVRRRADHRHELVTDAPPSWDLDRVWTLDQEPVMDAGSGFPSHELKSHNQADKRNNSDYFVTTAEHLQQQH